MKQFKIICPACGHTEDLSFNNIAVNMYGVCLNVQCTKCNEQHLIGGDPSYRKFEKGSRLYFEFAKGE